MPISRGAHGERVIGRVPVRVDKSLKFRSAARNSRATTGLANGREYIHNVSNTSSRGRMCTHTMVHPRSPEASRYCYQETPYLYQIEIADPGRRRRRRQRRCRNTVKVYLGPPRYKSPIEINLIKQGPVETSGTATSDLRPRQAPCLVCAVSRFDHNRERYERGRWSLKNRCPAVRVTWTTDFLFFLSFVFSFFKNKVRNNGVS